MSENDIYALALSTGMYTLDGIRVVISVPFKRFIIKHRDQIDLAIKKIDLSNQIVSPLGMAATSLWHHKKGLTLTMEQVGQLVCLFDDCLEAERIKKTLKDLWRARESVTY